uniref:U6 snRNA-associated Sm-like protein LSm4 n=1 Tax=Albugo laibachii Nc14 TaxID=890382 RepID=F0WHB5_9STRA|nr:unnamed protein product putative [Albugo laibachii Nc14]|eukprot:CCA20631.1 unnamed protein product putative [Albugo laibachii Nc14]
MLVELKNGDTYNGHFKNCDTWMNINLCDVICTSKDGDRFWKMPECYIRGNTVKYVRVPNEILGLVQEENTNRKDRQVMRGRGRGSRGGFAGRGYGRGRDAKQSIGNGGAGGRGRNGGRNGGRSGERSGERSGGRGNPMPGQSL